MLTVEKRIPRWENVYESIFSFFLSSKKENSEINAQFYVEKLRFVFLMFNCKHLKSILCDEWRKNFCRNEKPIINGQLFVV